MVNLLPKRLRQYDLSQENEAMVIISISPGDLMSTGVDWGRQGYENASPEKFGIQDLFLSP